MYEQSVVEISIKHWQVYIAALFVIFQIIERIWKEILNF